MTQSLIADDKLYELSLENKKHQENKRDEINNYYITLLSSMIAVIPFIDKVTTIIPGISQGSSARLFLTVLSFIGLILSTTWLLSIKRILMYSEILDAKIFALEKKYEIDYLNYISQQLGQKNAPSRVTKYQLVIPHIFRVVFVAIIIYSLSWLAIE